VRTKQVDGVLRLDVCRLDVKPELVIYYDGLGGISQRPILRDVVEELLRKGPEVFGDFLDAMRRSRRGGDVHIYFYDYVSYGIGGGDATAEYFFGRYMLLHNPARGDEPEQLLLLRPGGVERLPLDSFVS